MVQPLPGCWLGRLLSWCPSAVPAPAQPSVRLHACAVGSHLSNLGLLLAPVGPLPSSLGPRCLFLCLPAGADRCAHRAGFRAPQLSLHPKCEHPPCLKSHQPWKSAPSHAQIPALRPTIFFPGLLLCVPQLYSTRWNPCLSMAFPCCSPVSPAGEGGGPSPFTLSREPLGFWVSIMSCEADDLPHSDVPFLWVTTLAGWGHCCHNWLTWCSLP